MEEINHRVINNHHSDDPVEHDLHTDESVVKIIWVVNEIYFYVQFNPYY